MEFERGLHAFERVFGFMPESHAAAARLFENHPHFAIFPGESVEIMPILPIPAG